MGADGGYYYIKKSWLREPRKPKWPEDPKNRGPKTCLSDEDIELFIRFTQHACSFEVREESLDVEKWECDNGYLVDYYRLPEGTDFEGKLDISVWKDDEYANQPEEVWYYKEFSQEWTFKNGNGYYWFSHPESWYVWGHSDVKDDRGWFRPRITLPTPDELEKLVRITGWIEEHHPVDYLETWT